MIAQLVVCIIGFSSGFIVAGGVIALMVGLNIITRYAGITRTANRVWIYEDCILCGGLVGNILTIHSVSVPLGQIGLMVLGLCCGIFVGSWIMALADIVNIFPVFTRRIGLVKGMSLIVICIAIGKAAGSLLHFYFRW